MVSSEKWIEPRDVSVPEDFHRIVGGHQLVAKALLERGYDSVKKAQSFLEPTQYEPIPSSELPNILRAADRLEAAIQKGELICVWGDFDVDGQTSTTLLVSVLNALGATVTHHIPVRATESHGINLPKLKCVIDSGAQLILTCDTGVTAHEEIAYAQSQDVDVIVTDHHNLPLSLPDAHTVVNPKMLPMGHRLRELPGVGVAFKLGEELYTRSGDPAKIDCFLDLVALGIVADLAVLRGDVRYLLQRGLVALRRTSRLGLLAMMDLAEVQPKWLTDEDISYTLAPRLNSLGRLADANKVVEFLTTDDMAKARIMASELEGLNARRKLLCDQVTRAVQAQIESDPTLLDDAVLVLAHPTWPVGVIGIVASRLVDKYHRPTVLISSTPGGPARGSARSIEGLNISAAIDSQRELLLGFGGHPMAAGLSIEPDLVPEFRQGLSRVVKEMIGEMGTVPRLQIDGYLPLTDISLELVDDLERIAPFGPGNPSLTLATRGVTVRSARTIGQGGEHRLIIVEDEGGATLKVVWWQGAGWKIPEGRFDLAFVARASYFQGEREVQATWVDSRPVEGEEVVIKDVGRSIEVIDFRHERNSLDRLQRLRESENLQVWGEAGTAVKGAEMDRYHLGASEALAIWTIPPGPQEMRDVLDKVVPNIVYLFADDPGLSVPETFLKRLSGLIKYALRTKGGSVNLSTLAAATAHREITVRKGIAWLASRGDVKVMSEEEEELVLEKGGEQTKGSETELIMMELTSLLKETTSFRKYYCQAGKDALIELFRIRRTQI
jgi:single-stranded-DNA-specific exonuclease